MKIRVALTAVALAHLSYSTTCLAEDFEPVPIVPSSPAISVAGMLDKTIEVKTVRATPYVGEETGRRSFGIFCANSQPVHFAATSNASIVGTMTRDVHAALEKAGYTKYESSESAFGSQGSHSPDFQLAATVKAVREDLCVSGATGTGSTYYKVFWEIFSTHQQKVVFTKTTEGSFKTTASTKIGEIYENAETNAINNLLADPALLAALQEPAVAEAPTTNAVTADRITLAAVSPPAGGMAKNVDALTRAVVTVEGNVSSGTGFYIDRTGYLLTARHVVQDARFVRIRMLNGDTSVGEVIRADAARDVALIKTASVSVNPLSVRVSPPSVAEEVYAIGSPMGSKFSGTVSKGILSAERSLENKTFLQSDVGVTFGSSGGPLFDASGAVIGLTQSGIPSSGNINFFIPINDALKKLDVAVQ